MSTEDTKEKVSLWTRMKTRWRLLGPWHRTFILLDIVLILNLLFMLGAWLLHPLVIVVIPGEIETHLALVCRFPFHFISILAIVGSAFSAVVTPMDMFPDKRFRVIALFLISWMGTITTLVCLFFQNQWCLVMSPITGVIPYEPYPGFWAYMGLQNVIYNHLTLLPLLMVLGFFGMIIAYLFQYWILG